VLDDRQRRLILSLVTHQGEPSIRRGVKVHDVRRRTWYHSGAPDVKNRAGRDRHRHELVRGTQEVQDTASTLPGEGPDGIPVG
jgi:hypothetical protein